MHFKRFIKVSKSHFVDFVHFSPTLTTCFLFCTGIIPAHLMDSVWAIMQNMQVSALPDCIKEMQYKAICRTHFKDQARIRARRLVHVCIFCAFKQGTTSCRKRSDKSKNALYYTKFRIDCQTNTLLCVACNTPSVIAINLLGRILRLGRMLLVLSTCCGTIIRYNGSGHEFAGKCCEYCTPCVANTGGKKTSRSNCSVCEQRGAQQTLRVLDVPARAIVACTLCGRHRIPDHLSQTIFDHRELNVVLGKRRAR